MTCTAHWMKAVLIAVIAIGVVVLAGQSYAADLPVASASPLTGVSFDDKPLLLPVQRNFQMAMLTSSSELGRSCGKMEAYGWRMSQAEQGRVNQIFNNTVDRLRLMGYTVSPQVLSSVSKDITLFTADRPEKHFLFLWSAGELGLVLNLCQTTAPTGAHAMDLTPSVQVFPILTNDVVTSDLEAVRTKNTANFTPAGSWSGGYACAQGYTGGTLKISSLRGKNFEGEFSFYPTQKNMSVPKGAYTVYGQYDADSKRILINPGHWLERPRNFYYTVIVGSFDPVKDTFSGFFQGINGCTSFEAVRSGGAKETARAAKKHAAKKKTNKPAARKVQPSADLGIVPPGIDLAPTAVPPAPVATAPAAVPVTVPPGGPTTAATAAAAMPVAAPTPIAPVTPAATTAAPAAAAPPAASTSPIPLAPALAPPPPVQHASPLPVPPPPHATVVPLAPTPAPAPAAATN